MSGTTPRIIIVPRWAGTASDDWYPWAAQTLGSDSAPPDLQVLDLPDPGTPTLESWVPPVRQALGDEPETSGEIGSAPRW